MRAFWQATALPSGVRGPVERSAFWRFAASRAGVAIGPQSIGHGDRIQAGRPRPLPNREPLDPRRRADELREEASPAEGGEFEHRAGCI